MGDKEGELEQQVGRLTENRPDTTKLVRIGLPAAPAPLPGEPEPASKPSKRRDKVRSAWISFVGRIVAQIVGALATVVLGLLLARKIYPPGSKHVPPPTPDPAPAASASAGVVRSGVSIAVLPFANISGDPQQEFFTDGMTEAIITDLAKVHALRVISRTSVMRYKGDTKPLPEIARELGVSAIVEGSVLRAGNRVRVSAQLIDAATDEHLWAESYDRDLKDVLSLQDELARSITREVRVVLTPLEQEHLSVRSGPVNPEAHVLYLRGRHAWNLRTVGDLQQAARFFEEAVARDGNYAPAYAGLADTYALLGSSGYGAIPPREAMPRARAAAERALALDGTLASARTSLAFVRQHYDWDFAAAETDYRRALELAPGYAPAHQWYAGLLAEQGRNQEALAEARRALDYDPVSLVMYRTLSYVSYLGRDFDAAILAAERGLKVHPGSPGLLLSLAMARFERGDRAEAIRTYEGLVKAGAPETVLGYLGNAYARAGQKQRAAKSLAALETAARERYVPRYLLALVRSGLGDREAALHELARSVEERSDFVLGARFNPLLDSLRADPRLAGLLTRVVPGGTS
jgi:TolB-like protein/Tfp pilus assembly protein PilF